MIKTVSLIIMSLLVTIPFLQTYGQKTGFKGELYEDLEVTNSIIKSYGDSVYHFQVKAYDEGRTLSVAGKRFYWFHQGEVKTTVGASAGKVLHGKFEQFDRDGNLKEKGSFRNGAKEGIWLRWYPNGEIASKYFWKDGFRNGRFDEYYTSGKISRSGTFRQDLLNGKLSTYQPDGVVRSTVTYKKGIEQKRKQKKEKKIKEKKTKEEKVKEKKEKETKAEDMKAEDMKATKEPPSAASKKRSEEKIKKTSPVATHPKKKFTLFKRKEVKEQPATIKPPYEKKN